MKKTIFSLTASVVLAAAIAGCSTVDSANKWGSDAWITTQLKTQEMGAAPAIWSDIKVETNNAVVQLSGFAKSQADINTLVVEAVEIVQPSAEGKDIGLQIDIPPRLPLVDLDADMIRRVIINLMDNSIKYTPEGGVVTISARAAPAEVIVSVRDTGPGIPSDQHTRIFARFARLQREAAPKGMGLGLTFCKLAIEAHGGKIWVESQVGHGSTFSFRLPM